MGAEQFFIGVLSNAAKEQSMSGVPLYGRKTEYVNGISTLTKDLPKGIDAVVGIDDWIRTGTTTMTLTDGMVYGELRYLGASPSDLDPNRMKKLYPKNSFSTTIAEMEDALKVFKTSNEHSFVRVGRFVLNDNQVGATRQYRDLDKPGEQYSTSYFSLGFLSEFQAAVKHLKKASKKK